MVAIKWLNYTYAATNIHLEHTPSWWSILVAVISAPYMYCFDDGWCYGFETADGNASLIHDNFSAALNVSR